MYSKNQSRKEWEEEHFYTKLLWTSVFAYLTLFQKMPGAITPKDLIKPNSIEPNVIEHSRLLLFKKKIIVPLDWVGSSFKGIVLHKRDFVNKNVIFPGLLNLIDC